MHEPAVHDAPVSSGTTVSGLRYEVHGSGEPLFLGFPLMASHAEIFGEDAGRVRRGFLERLLDSYRVLFIDYPSIGGSTTIPPSELTVDRVIGDLLEVADAAGFERFAWWGGTFGAVAGMALAARSQRVSALVCAGWSPLGMPYSGIAAAARAQLGDPPPHARAVLRSPSQYAQWCTFYDSLGDAWETRTVPAIRCPRAVIYGEHAATSAGSCPLPLAATIRSRRAELAALGWHVAEIPAADAGLVFEPELLVPAVREFLDTALKIHDRKPFQLAQQG
jgi:pimeloyl-ACP methyl ester carboxylesterase